MGEACKKFDTPVTGGNVSFYNQSTDDGPVFPTPTIGMLGILQDFDDRMTLTFKDSGHLIYLIGESGNDLEIIRISRQHSRCTIFSSSAF